MGTSCPALFGDACSLSGKDGHGRGRRTLGTAFLYRESSKTAVHGMKRTIVIALHLAGASLAAYAVPVADSMLWLNDRSLRDSTVYVQGVLHSMPGIDLLADGRPCYVMGGDTSRASRWTDDRHWPVVPHRYLLHDGPAGTYWVRFHLRVDPSLSVPVVLALSGHGSVEAYHNGRLIVRSGGWSDEDGGSTFHPRSHAVLPLARDGLPEVITLRLLKDPREMAWAAWGHPLVVALHSAEVEEAIDRSATRSRLEFGFFGGVNALILVLAAVIWWRDRRERSWGLLALFALLTVGVTAVYTLPKVDLGMSSATLGVWLLVGDLIYPFSIFLLVLLMRDLFAVVDRRTVLGFGMLTLVMVLGKITPLAELVDPLFVSFLFFLEVARLSVQAVRQRHQGGWVVALGGLVFIVFGVVLDNYYPFTGQEMPMDQRTLMRFSYYVAMPMAMAVYLAIRSAHHNKLVARQRDDLDREVQERTAELRAERDRSEHLLLNILPEEVANELKTHGEAAARHFDQATILFTDFKGFTQMSEQVSPAELLRELNTCFTAFDAIVERYGVEKIKTIGDAYMCAGGLPDPAQGSPADVVHAALDMQAHMASHKAERQAAGKPFFEMRVGIHTGPVVAGIVGVKKFAYDIWGDTVNTASRMESSGEVGQVNISEATYELVKNEPDLMFTSRGKVQAKGKGEMEMYFVATR
jgi:class 3 adenylate cyclase